MRPRTASRLAWSLTAIALLLVIGGIAVAVADQRVFALNLGALFLGIIPFMLVGTLIASRFPGNPIGWIFCAVGLLQAVQVASYEYAVHAVLQEPGSLPFGALATWISSSAWMPSIGLLTTYLFLLFPDGHPPSPGWRWAGWTGGIGLGLVVLAATVGNVLASPRDLLISEEPSDYPDLVGAVLLVGFVAVLTASIASVSSLVVRFRRSSGDERQQLKWMAYAATFALTVIAIQFFPVGLPGWFQFMLGLGLFAVPVASGVAILKYRLYDIDVVINKTVVYGALAAFVTVVYVGIVVGIGALIGNRGNVFLTILATAIIALAFQPARVWARHLANRLVYGKRATPYEAMSEFAERVATTYSLDEVLPRMARIAAEGTGAERVEVWVRLERDLLLDAAWPDRPARRQTVVPVDSQGGPSIPEVDRAVPVTHQEELLGAIGVVMPRAEPLTPAGEKLLEDLASQAGLVLRNVRLIEQLRASRQRLVAAQDQERRRLERNIHDGAQQQLVALSVKMRLLKTLAQKDPGKAGELVDQLQADAQDALDDLRDLARGIYPPLLADQGLAAALEAQARKAAVPVQVQPDGLGRYAQEAEATAYFCVLEALQNVAKYAGATGVEVRLSERDGELRFSVADDGAGFDVGTTPRGAGLQNMVDRVEALGGSLIVSSSPGAGTTISGSIPV